MSNEVVDKALILAAGLGTRLAPLTDNCPKALVQVNGEPILFRQIENLHKAGIYDIVIISGYKAEFLEETVREKYPDVKIIRNSDYLMNNNMYSAFMAESEMTGHGFIMMNTDVFCDASVVSELVRCESENAIVTDVGKFIAESMKVVEIEGRLIEISKDIPKSRALGVSIDIYKFSAHAGEKFFAKCREYIEEKGEIKKWSEVALNDILCDVKFEACPLVGRWVEIDNFDDLHEAEMIFSETV